MTTLVFNTHVPLWLVLALAVAGAALVWRLYRREAAGRLRPPLHWLLPTLRALVIFLVILTLAGPTLRRGESKIERSHVEVLVDASASMGLTDGLDRLDRKLEVARVRGWLPEGAVDFTPLDLARRLAAWRESFKDLRQPGVSATAWREAASRAAADAARWLGELKRLPPAQLPPNFTTEFEDAIAQPADRLSRTEFDPARPAEPRRLWLALLNQFNILETRLHSFFIETNNPRAAQEPVLSALKKFDGLTRWQRVAALLFDGKSGVMRELAADHDVELSLLSGSGTPVTVWRNDRAAALPTDLSGQPEGAVTDLGAGLARPPAAAPSSALVLISDGRHNQGEPPVALARQLGRQGIPVHTVALGLDRMPPDLALTAVQYTEVIYQDDRVRGTLDLLDSMPADQAFTVRIVGESGPVWERKLTTQGTGERRLAFEFSLAELLAAKPAADSAGSITLQLTAEIALVPGETHTNNNAQPLIVVKAAPRRAKILVVDGRPRWESRYIRNLFTRDKNWDVNGILLTPGQALAPGDKPGQFPVGREGLFAYDLIVLGELPPQLLPAETAEWLRDFVRDRGGGLILVDGARGHLRAWGETALRELLPVAWSGGDVLQNVGHFRLTAAGTATPFLGLAAGLDENQALWRILPAPQQVVRAQALPGAAVLAELEGESGVLPALVFQQAGAGRVLYCAFDESWRWRYRTADEFHARYWNQLARGVMEKPCAVNTKLVSLDTDALVYHAGQQAAIRVRLRDEAGKPLDSASAEAILTWKGQPPVRVPLKSGGGATGLFRGVSAALAEGRCELTVQAVGLPTGDSEARLAFTVLPARSPELAIPSANRPLLRQIAEASGGTALDEEEAGRLSELLKPMRQSRLLVNEFPLWQSYWWFGAIIALAAFELFFRKRAGML